MMRSLTRFASHRSLSCGTGVVWLPSDRPSTSELRVRSEKLVLRSEVFVARNLHIAVESRQKVGGIWKFSWRTPHVTPKTAPDV
jgi:hypothetical protein